MAIKGGIVSHPPLPFNFRNIFLKVDWIKNLLQAVSKENILHANAWKSKSCQKKDTALEPLVIVDVIISSQHHKGTFGSKMFSNRMTL